MSLVYLTAGAAGMYCGSCMHDNALAKALVELGEDCLLVPVYTPIRTDEEDMSIDQVFYGGVNVYLQQKMPWLAYLPMWLDRGLNHAGLIRRLTQGAMKTDPRFLGALTVSMLRGMQGNQRKELARLCDWLQSSVQPRQLILTNMLIAGCVPEIQRRLPVQCYVTLQGDDIFIESLPQPYRDQAVAAMQRIVPQITGFIVHSQVYGEKMAELLKIPSSKWQVLPLGIALNDFQNVAWEPPQGPITIGYLARTAPEKGLDLLVDAFIALNQQHPSWDVRLDVAGWKGPQHESYFTEQLTKLEKANLLERFRYHGDVNRTTKMEFLAGLDVFCVPTRYREPKGLFVLEAAASGLPYVLPNHGAFPELHHRLQFGTLFEPETPSSLTAALEAMVLQGRQGQAQRQAAALRAQQEVGIEKHATALLQWMRAAG